MVKDPPVNIAAKVLLEENGFRPHQIVRVDPDAILWSDRRGRAYTTFVVVDGKTVSVDTVRGFEL